MTAPDMESIIAAALRVHALDPFQPDFWLCCECGENWPVDGPYVKDIPGTFAAHQARAVLASISEAGAVEWGVRWDYMSEMYPERTDWAQSPEAAQSTIDKSFATGSVVTRIAAGPWTAVEGWKD